MSVATTATPSAVPDLEQKATSTSPDVGLLGSDDNTGVVEAIVSVTGVVDHDNDVIEPGSYTKTLANRRPKGIFVHDWAKWVARTEEITELMPGDHRLPPATKDGKPWPATAGGLYVKCRFNLNTDEGRNAYHNVKFFSETGECEWSVGYRVPAGKSTKDKQGIRHIKEMDLYEYSPVLFGANSMSGTLAVKSLNTPAGTGTDADADTGEDWVDLDEAVDAVADDDLPADTNQQTATESDDQVDETGVNETAADGEAKTVSPFLRADNMAATASALDAEMTSLRVPRSMDRANRAALRTAFWGVSDALNSEGAGLSLAKASLESALDSLRDTDNDPVIQSFTIAGRALVRRVNALISQMERSTPILGVGEGKGLWTAAQARLHPRDDDGQFASSGGGGGKPGAVDAHLATPEGAANLSRAQGTTIADEAAKGGQRGQAGSAAQSNGWAPNVNRSGGVNYYRGDEFLSVQYGEGGSFDRATYRPYEYSSDRPVHSMDEVLQHLKGAPKHDDDDSDLEDSFREAEMEDDRNRGKAMAHESLDRSPRSNWVEKAGQLPAYIQHIAKDIHEKRGLPLSQAIPIAIAAVKKWAAGGDDVTAETRTKAAKAVAEWEKLKASAKKDVGDEAESTLFPYLPGTYEELREQIRQGASKTLAALNPDLTHVEVLGTWPGHAVVTAYMVDDDGAREAKVFEVPYMVTVGEGPETVTMLEPEPVQLTVSVDGGSEVGGKMLPFASQIDDVTVELKAFLEHGETKAGRVLSGVNERRLVGAVESLVAVLKAAGLEVLGKEKQSDEKVEETVEENTDPNSYDSTAPSARSDTKPTKTLGHVDPALLARAYRIQAEAAARRTEVTA